MMLILYDMLFFVCKDVKLNVVTMCMIKFLFKQKINIDKKNDTHNC